MPPPGVPAAGHVASARPRPAANPVSPAPRMRAAAERQRNTAQERRRGGRPETVGRLAHRRADTSTPARIDFNVAVTLHERGDLAGAIAAYRRAERRGDPDAAFNLGVLLCESGDLDGAETSWRRSAHHGNARATEDLGFLVRHRRERQAAGTDSVPQPHNKTARRAFRPQVIPMDSAIAPMAADAFSRMAYDTDDATHPDNEPRAEDESEDPGDAG